jgi:hypothetical protein
VLKAFVLRYWPLAVLGALVIAILATSRYTEHRKAENQNYTQASSPQASVTPDNASKSTENADKAKHRPDFIDTFTWPEGATVWALLLTLFVIAWQSAETREAAKAAKDSAEAALLNANALVNAERGRLVVVYSTSDPDSSEAGMFEFEIRNIGRCPALLTFARLRVLFLTPGQELPEEPPRLEDDDPPYPEEWVLPNDSTPLLVADALQILDLSGKGLLAPPEKIEELVGGDLEAWVYGRIRYFDGITTLETTSGFCYYLLCDEGRPQWLMRGGPAAYWKEERHNHPNHQKAN